jgi:hypothetical protein
MILAGVNCRMWKLDIPPVLSSMQSIFTCGVCCLFFFLALQLIVVVFSTARQRPLASSFSRFLDYTQRRSTVGRTPLDEWSIRRRNLYLTTHNNHNRQISMPLVGFEPTISAVERPKTYVLDRAANWAGFYLWWEQDFPHLSGLALRPLNLLCNGYRVFPRGKTDGTWCWPPTPSSAEVKTRIGQYFYSPSGPSWTVLGWILPLPLP